ncbi:MAG: YlmC/YmxH family sporulation protein [Clostridia bacterium]|nr:YlmC/YmxH family sporulation protein [Clostridia bacterium]
MEISFCELRIKEVVNVCDGKRLGNIVDLVFDTSCARVTGIVVPGERTFLNLFKSNNDIFIPYNRIRKIGKDVILVELTPIGILSNKDAPPQPAQLPPTNIMDSSNTQ